MMPFFLVGLGGCAGALARYSITLILYRYFGVLPFGTLAANLAGCFVIGIIAQLAAANSGLSIETRLLLATGFCGGFTTLSSLILELTQLLRDGAIFNAAAYFLATFIGAFISFYAGAMAVKLVAP